ncbi:MAG TPA: DegV family protein [Chloroflexota bacterium]
MAKIRVVTDSTADMDTDAADRLGITMVPLNVHWNGSTYQDKVEISIDEFYRKLREEKGTPKTSQPSAGQFEQVYRDLLRDADGIVSVHISGKLSGTLNSAQLAARAVAPDRIVVVDSLTTSFALGAVAARVAELAGSGAGLGECAALAEDLVPRARLIAAVDTLEFLRRGGRIGRAQAFAGNLLSIKLIFQIREGEVYPSDRVRTRAAVIKRTAELVRDLGPLEEGAILYGDDPAPAEQLRELVREAYPNLRLTTGRIGPVLGTHTGPGVIGFASILAKDW